MSNWKLPPILLPESERRALWVDGDVITEAPIEDAEELPGKYVCPGLVDSHIHLALRDFKPLGLDDALGNLRAARDQGVLLVRDMGAPHSVTLDITPDPTLPPVIASGRHMHIAGEFLPDCQDPTPPEALVDAALAEVRRGATWVKVITDWNSDELSYPPEILATMVEAVHAEGARVAAHSQQAGVREVVLAGVDSIEHGTGMDVDSLVLMADRGVAWVPTAGAFEKDVLEMRKLLEQDDLESGRRVRIEDWLPRVQGWVDTQRSMIPEAFSMGVTVLASTDNSGSVAEEVERFVRYGVESVIALQSATSDARRFLGAPGLVPGALADLVTFDVDPREDPASLAEPVAILLRGRRIL